MLEAGVPEGVIREIAGHVDPAMTQHYSHPRLAARRAAVETLMTAKLSPDDGRHVTKQLLEGNVGGQVIEKNGTPGVIRTPDPLLRRQVLYPAELRAHERTGSLAMRRRPHYYPPTGLWLHGQRP